MAEAIKVGSFTMTPEGGITGPADYINSPAFDACVAGIKAGTNTVLNYGLMNVGRPGFAANNLVALLVAIQTDYAAWHGAQMFNRRMERFAAADGDNAAEARVS